MNFIAEIPWWIPSALLVAGGVLAWTANARRLRGMMRGGSGLIGLAIVLIAVSWMLESDREQVRNRTRQLVKAVAGRDWQAMKSLLHPEAEVMMLRGRDAVIKVASTAVEASSLQSAKVISMGDQEIPPDYIVTLQVMGDFRDGSVLSNWKLEWTKGEAGWVLIDAEFMGGPGLSTSDVERYLRLR